VKIIISLLNKLRNFVRPFGKIIWVEKDSCDVLVYDSGGSEEILRCVPLNIQSRVFPVRDGYLAIKSFVFFVYVFFFNQV